MNMNVLNLTNNSGQHQNQPASKNKHLSDPILTMHIFSSIILINIVKKLLYRRGKIIFVFHNLLRTRCCYIYDTF
jgi:hypothetical protein